MKHRITRRDFLDGIALAIGGASPLRALASDLPISDAAQDTLGYYPPLLNGMRGNHPGSFENAHALRDGQIAPAPVDTGEQYDLIVVGGGISGLAAAHFYRAVKRNARILILDNHDDFGGHAKRNEFKLGGQLHLINGGTLEIDSPRPYSRVAAGLVKNLGIDVDALAKSTQHLKFYEHMGLKRGLFFDRETFGEDKLVVGAGSVPYSQLLASAPLSERAREQITQLQEAQIDYLPGLSSDAKKQHLSRISYQAFMLDLVKVEPAVIKFYYAQSMAEQGIGIDAISALDCWGIGYPGFQGMQLAKGSIARMGYTPGGYADTGGSYKLHFPDGNATIARLLVRDLIPAAVPGSGVENIITARVRYAQLDRAGQPVRLRLNSTVLAVTNLAAGVAARNRVEIRYERGGKTFSTRATGAVLACYNMMIPYLCPELPEAQKSALHKLVKTPLVYTNVALRDWRAFAALAVHHVYAPGSYHTSFSLNPAVDIGAYRSERAPSKPMLVRMVRTPGRPGLSEHEQNRAGRRELLGTTFETFERNIRDQLNRTLGAGGFDADRDITAITVNRWAHGYAPEYNPLWDGDLPESQRPNVIGRARLGGIVIANSDAGAAAYTDSAIDQAHRAVGELLDG